MINVSKTYLPPLEDYVEYLRGIWDRSYVTNQGPLELELEKELREYLNVKHLFLVSSGTIALQIAIKSLERTGEIITTPFSYIATTSSIIWEGCMPVFVDIDPETLNIDEDQIERAITKETIAILATHVFGNACNIDRIESIAKRHNLKVIYDAAHTFGVFCDDRSLASYGDISCLSFHAAKIFHTVQGGALVTDNDEIASKLSYMRNFGHKGIHQDFWGLGINGKNCELHAAMGLSILPKIGALIRQNRRAYEYYERSIKRCQRLHPMISSFNYHYFPILFNSEVDLAETLEKMKEQEIFPRRYFYPSLNTISYVRNISFENYMPVSELVARRIVCLPLYYDLSEKDIDRIINCLP
jgi:dTDP-4-amino-4,6-dideoxygalactose transaminase